MEASLYTEVLFTYNFQKMNTIEAQGNWNKQKGKLKQKTASYIGSKKMFDSGMKDEIAGRFQIIFGKIKQKLNKLIANL